MRPQDVELLPGKLENEVFREAFPVAAQLLVKPLGSGAVEDGEVGVENDALIADGENECGRDRAV